MQNRTISLIFLLCGLCVWFGCAVNNEAVNQIQTGHEFFAERRYDEAIGAYQQSLKQAPKSIEAWNYIGLAYIAQQRWNQAISAYQAALKINPNLPEIHSNLGFAYHQLKRLDDAIAAYQTALAIDPKRPVAYYRLGLAYEAKGRYESARGQYLKAIELSGEQATNHNPPRFSTPSTAKNLLAYAYYHLGIIYGMGELYEQAIETYQKAIALMPNLTDAHYRLGKAYHATYHYDAAIIAYRAASEFVQTQPLQTVNSLFARISHIPPTADAVQFHLGLAYAAQRRYEEAIRAYEEAIATAPNHADAYYQMGLAYRAQKRHIAAMRAFQNAGFYYGSRNDQRTAKAAYEEVLLSHQAIQRLQRVGDVSDAPPSGEELTTSATGTELTATEKRRRLIEIEEVLTATYDQLGTVRTKLEEYDLAIDDYHRAGEFYESHGKFLEAIDAYNRQAFPIRYRIAETCIRMAELALTRGNMEEMVQWSGDAMAKSQKSPKLLSRLGTLFLDAGMSDDAVEAFRLALELNPESVELARQLARLYEKRGEISDAEGVYRNILRHDPLNVEARQRLGQIYRRLKKNREAAEIYQQLGEIYCAQETWESMIAAYKTALAMLPTVAPYHYQLGWAYAQHGQHTAAVASYHRVLDLWGPIAPSPGESSGRSVNLWKLESSADDVIAFVLTSADQLLIQASPATPPSREHIYYQIGVSEAAGGNYANAVEAFGKIIPERGKWFSGEMPIDFYLVSNALYRTGLAYDALGEIKLARKAYTDLLKLRPDFAPGYRALGDLYRQSQKHKQAITAYLNAIALGEDAPEVYDALGGLYAKTGNLVDAVQSYDLAGKGYILRAQTLEFPKTQLENALNAYQQTVQLSERLLTEQSIDIHTLKFHERLVLAHYRLGLIFQAWGQHEQAIERFNTAQQLAVSLRQQSPPQNNTRPTKRADSQLPKRVLVYIHYASGRSHIELSNPDSSGYLQHLEYASEAFSRVVNINRHAAVKVEQWLLANTYYELGKIYAEQNQHVKAIEVYQKALIAKPNHLEAKYHLGESYQHLKRFQDAIDTYQTIVSIAERGMQIVELRIWKLINPTNRGSVQVTKSQLLKNARIEDKSLDDASFFKSAIDVSLFYFQSTAEGEQRARFDSESVTTYLPRTYRQLGRVYEMFAVSDELKTARWLQEAVINTYKAGLTYEAHGKNLDALEAYDAVGRLYTELADVERAMLTTDSASKFGPFTQRFAVAAYLRAGDLYKAQSEQIHAMADYDAALTQYQAALKLTPKRIRALVQRGEMHTRKQEWREANEQFQTAFDVEKQLLATLYYRQGRSYQAGGQNEGALLAYNEALKYGELPIVHYQSGRIYMSQENRTDAISSFDDALGLIPSQTGDLLLERQSKPYEVQLNTLTGDVYFHRGLAKELEQGFHEAITNFSNAGHAYFEAAEVIRRLGGANVDFVQMNDLLDLASAAYRKVTLIGESRIVEMSQLESDMLLAEAYYQSGRVHARASEVYTLRNKPNESENLHSQAERDFQNAIIRCLKHTLADMPESHPTLLGDTHFAKATLYSTRAEKLHFAIQEYEWAGLAYEDQRYFSKAVEAYNAVLAIDSDYAHPYFYLGRTYERYAIDHEAEAFQQYIETAIAYYQNALYNSLTDDGAKVRSASQTRFNTPELMLQSRYGLARCFDYLKQYRRAVTQFKAILDRLLQQQVEESEITRRGDGEPTNTKLMETAYRQIAELGPKATGDPPLDPESKKPLLSDAEIYYCIGLARAHFEAYPSAIDMYDQAILHLDTALDQPIESYQDASALNRLADTYRERGVAFTALGNFESAYQSYHQAAAGYKKLKRYWQQQAYIYEREEVINFNVETLRGLLDRSNRAYQHAEDTYKKVIGIKSNDVAPIFQLGLLYESQKNFQKAIETYFTALSTDSDQMASAYRLGSIYAMKTDSKAIDANYTLAQEQFQRVIEKSWSADIEPILVAQSHAQLGLIYAVKADFESALEEFDLATEALAESTQVTAPDQIGVDSATPIDAIAYQLYYLGLANSVKSRMGETNYSVAVSAFQQAIRAYSTFGDAYHQLGLVYANVKNYELAKRQFENAIRLYQASENDHPNLANVYYQLGYVYYHTENYDSAWRQLFLAELNGKQRAASAGRAKSEAQLELERSLKQVSISPIR